MAIPIVEAAEVRSGRGSATKGEKYGKYSVGIKKSVPWIKQEIENSAEKKIFIKSNEIKKEMGGEFVKKNDTSIYWGLKYALFQEGVVVGQGTHKDNGRLLVFRLANDSDRLPPSLSKYLETDEEPGPIDIEEDLETK
jgi:hypothetical protein